MSFSAPAPDVCAQARLARDPRFDGVFFTAVRTTGIYCRPVCPVPPAKERNVRYFANAAQAEAAGFRPCMRCRPELSPADGAWRRSDAVVARALRLIEHGALDDGSVEDLAQRLNVGDRHLRRMFAETLGTTPQQVQATRRLLFAKQLLTETRLPVTEIASASGFASLRRFNDAFAKGYGIAPSNLRKQAEPDAPAGPLTLQLAFRPPFDFAATLAFLRQRALPGIEHVDAASYTRVLDPAFAAGEDTPWLRVSKKQASSLQLQLHGVAATQIGTLVQRVRRMFDLDADPAVIAAQLSRDPMLATSLKRHPGLRIPCGWDGMEVAIRAVLGQQVTVAAASTLAKRLVARLGKPLARPISAELNALFPSAETIAEADLSGLGLPGKRAETLRNMARALRDGDVDFAPEQTLEDFVACWRTIPGIGDWTAQYVALRGLRHPDAFPAGDLILRKQAGEGIALNEKQLAARAEQWKPWRAYAVIHLWHAAGLQQGKS